MTAEPRTPFSGVLAPVLTPFDEDLAIDRAEFTAFCKRLLDDGCDGLAVFGTTSEANSLSLTEKRSLLDALSEDGIPGDRLLPGTGASNIPEAVELTKAAVEAGARGVLILPPFYFKNVGDEGVYRYYAELIERVGDERLRVYLYHIPQMSGVGLSEALIGRLRNSYGKTIAGLKDSSGDWSNTEKLIRAFPNMAFFPGSEKFLVRALAIGGAGCISATANWQPGAIRRLFENPDDRALEKEVLSVRAAFDDFPLIPGLKAAVARRERNEGWRRVRPPLEPLGDKLAGRLKSTLGL